MPKLLKQLLKMQDVVIPIGEFMVWTFELVIERLQNSPNDMIVILMFFGLFIWLAKQHKYNQEAEKNPGQIK